MTTTRFGRAAPAPCQLPRVNTYLAEVLDEFATRRLAQRGVPEPSRCLVTGAGTGSVASWLASELGIDGEVVVTGTDPCRVPAYPGVTALRHDLATDPLAADSFQLIYARLPLTGLANRGEQLAKLVTTLAPGGTIVLDELETGSDGYLLDAPNPPAGQILAESGLIDVDTECWARPRRGGQPGCLVVSTAGTKQLAAGRRLTPGQPESRSSSRWNSHAPAAWRPGRPPSG